MPKYRSALELEIARVLGDEPTREDDKSETEYEPDSQFEGGDGEIRKIDGSSAHRVRIFPIDDEEPLEFEYGLPDLSKLDGDEVE